MKSFSPSAPSTTQGLPSTGGSRGRRATEIVDAASELFAERGFEVTTREIARRLRISQALLYRYFPTKEQLVEAVLETVLCHRADCDSVLPGLAGRGQAERIGRVLAAFLGNRDRRWWRLSVWAALSGRHLPLSSAQAPLENALRWLVDELRGPLGIAPLADLPMLPEEREIAISLHGSAVMLGLRLNIYNVPVAQDLSSLVMARVRMLLPGVLAELRRLHGCPA
jgi:AcrR family transcriptional regulator